MVTRGLVYTCSEYAPPIIVYLNTEVNARYPAAVDRHIRVVQWNHWTRDKCRFAQSVPTCIMSGAPGPYQPHAPPSICSPIIYVHDFTHTNPSCRRWQELCRVLAYCNEKAQQ